MAVLGLLVIILFMAGALWYGSRIEPRAPS
jgi:hypothetical protein